MFEFTSLISASMRKDTDWVARYGDEEFLIVLNNTENDLAFNIAENLRNKIEEKLFECDGNKIKITASFGIYTYEDYETGTIDVKNMIDIADKKLYRAKQEGRNKCIK